MLSKQYLYIVVLDRTGREMLLKEGQLQNACPPKYEHEGSDIEVKAAQPINALFPIDEHCGKYILLKV